MNRSLRFSPKAPVPSTRATNPQATLAFRMPERLKSATGPTRPFAQHAVAYSAMRAVAQAISAIPFLVRVGRDEEDEDILRDGPWVRLFDKVNPVMHNRTEFWERTVLHLLSPSGECVLVKESGNAGRVAEDEIPSELWPINGQFFEPRIDPATKLPALWLYTAPEGTGKPIPYLPHELVILKFPNPENFLRGLGPLAPGNAALKADWKAQRWNDKFFDNDASPGGLLVAERPLNQEQRDRIIETWEERHRGQERRSRIGLLEGGLDYKPTGISQREMEFGSLRQMSWSELMMVFGVTELDLGLSENINRSVAEVIERRFVTKTLLPVIRLIEDGLWEQLFRPVEGDSGSTGRMRRSLDYRLTEARSPRLSRRWNPQQARWQIKDSRSFVSYRDIRPSKVTETPKTGSDIWGEFDLSTVVALRDNLADLMDNAKKAVDMGVPFNEVNARLDLGFQPQEHGDIPFMPAHMMPVELLLVPQDPGAPTLPTGAPQDEQDDPDEAGSEPQDTAEEMVDGVLTREERERAVEWLTRRPKGRDAEWRKHLARLVPLEGRFRRKFTRWLHDLLAHQLKKVARKGDGRAAEVRAPDDKLSPEDLQRVLFASQEWARKLVSLTHPIYVDASRVGVESAFADLGGNFAFDVTDPRVVDVIAKRQQILMKVSRTMQVNVARTIEKGIANSETIHQIQDRIRASFRGVSAAKALAVARTEVASAVNTSRHMAFVAEGVEQHQWISARDEAVRDSHAAQDGDIVPIGVPFKNGLLYPNDPAGSAAECLNCRCVVIPVVPGRAAPTTPEATKVEPGVHVHVAPPEFKPIGVHKEVLRDEKGMVTGTKETFLYNEDAPPKNP